MPSIKEIAEIEERELEKVRQERRMAGEIWVEIFKEMVAGVRVGGGEGEGV